MFYFLLVAVRKDATVRVTSKGQVTIPKHIRKRAGIPTGSDVDFAFRDSEIVLRKASRRGRGADARQDQFAEYLDRVTGIVDLGMNTDAFMALLRGE
jgi:AbrB family looped-hinge helix DNA binding protein